MIYSFIHHSSIRRRDKKLRNVRSCILARLIHVYLQDRVEKNTMASWLNCTCCLSELTTFCYTFSDLSDLTTVAIWAILHFITIWTTGGNYCSYLSPQYAFYPVNWRSWLRWLSELRLDFYRMSELTDTAVGNVFQFLNLINCRAWLLQLSELHLLVPLLRLYNFAHVDPLHFSACEAGGSGCEELRKCPPSSPPVLLFVNGRKRKPK